MADIDAAFVAFHERMTAAGDEGRLPRDVLALMGIDRDEMAVALEKQVPLALQEICSPWMLVEIAILGGFAAGAIWQKERERG